MQVNTPSNEKINTGRDSPGERFGGSVNPCSGHCRWGDTVSGSTAVSVQLALGPLPPILDLGADPSMSLEVPYLRVIVPQRGGEAPSRGQQGWGWVTGRWMKDKGRRKMRQEDEEEGRRDAAEEKQG